MLVKLGCKNKPPFWAGGLQEIPEPYKDVVRSAVESYQRDSTNPRQSRTYRMSGGPTVYIQESEPRKARVC